MKKTLIRSLAVTGAMSLSALAFGPAAFAQSSTQMYQANLTSLNNSGATGTATVKVTGDQATVTIHTDGASAGLPHAQHIHIGGQGICPTMSADSNHDGVLSTVEGQPAYGAVKVSLTTSGDTSANSAVAVSRFPKADANGSITYSRTFTLPSGVTASDVANGVIVQHGVASIGGDKTKYDGSAKSQLDKTLPLEATAPTDCGKLVAMPVGGAATGGGSTAGTENVALFALGGVALVAAGAIALQSRRNFANRSSKEL